VRPTPIYCESSVANALENWQDTMSTLQQETSAPNGLVGLKRSILAQWFFDDIFFIAMLAMALAGVILRLPVIYWLTLMPIFALITIAEGWRHFDTRGERLGLACRVAAIWCALLLCIYLLYSGGVQGVMNVNASSLAMMTLLALGTFVAGVQARVWKICGVGVVLFLAVPGVGWLDQSPLLVTAASIAIVALGGVIWWVRQTQTSDEVAVEPTIRE
jgi:hypothetical protein